MLASSSEVSIELLNYLLSQNRVELKCVVTNPDKATGRGQALTQNSVANWCDDNKVNVKKVESNAQFIEVVKTFEIDLIITVAYGHILKDELLQLPKYGCINLHYSLLPKYRGAAPVQWAIMNGDQVTGVTVFQLDSGMDTGPIYMQQELEIQPDEGTKDLIKRLNYVGVDLVKQTLELIASGVKPIVQPSDGACIAPKFKKEDGLLNWNLSAFDIYNRFRAIGENPGVYTNFSDDKVKINHMRVLNTDSLTAGAFQLINGELTVGTNTFDIAIENLTPAGRKMMTGNDFINGLTTKESLKFA